MRTTTLPLKEVLKVYSPKSESPLQDRASAPEVPTFSGPFRESQGTLTASKIFKPQSWLSYSETLFNLPSTLDVSDTV